MLYEVALAEPSDDDALRRLLRRAAVPGRVTVTFEREPSFFAGLSSLGPFHQVIVARERSSGEIAGVACRAARRLWVNGEPRDVGYLGLLRIDPRHQGRGLLTAGFRFLRELHGDGRVSSYLTSIVDGNALASTLLVERRRPSVPRYRKLTRLLTLAIPVGRGLDRRPSRGERAELGAFLAREGARRPFFPVIDDLDPADFLVARSAGGALAGVVALWDQSATKQTVVRGYAPPLLLARPLINAWQRLRGAPGLPAIGEPIRSAYAGLAVAVDDDPLVFRELLILALAEARRRSLDYVLLGLTPGDPLLYVVRGFRPIVYPSTIYSVAFPGDEDGLPVPTAVPPRLEIAFL